MNDSRAGYDLHDMMILSYNYLHNPHEPVDVNIMPLMRNITKKTDKITF